MTDNLPAVRGTALPVARDTDSWTDVVKDVAMLAESVAKTTFVPEALRNNVPGTAAAILYGREIGLPPMTALQTTHVIKGKVGVSAEIQRALVLSAGHEIEYREVNSGRCIIAGRRAGSTSWTEVTYSIDDARTAGLLNNNNYKNNPTDMLIARASTRLCRMLFPDVIRGMASAEELEDLDEDGGPAPIRARATVQRKSRATKTDDGAATADAPNPPALAGPSPAPSSPPLPPLPGEPGFDDPSAAATAEPAGSGAATPLDPVAPESASDPVEKPEAVEYMTEPQRGKLFALMGEAGLKDRDAQLEWISKNLGRVVESRTSLTLEDARILIDVLEQDAPPKPVSRGDLRLLAGLFKELEISDAQERLHIASSLIGRTPEKDGKPSAEGLWAHECQNLIQALGRCRNREDVEALIVMAEGQRAEDGEA